MTEARVVKKSRETQALNQATEELLNSIRAKDVRFRRWFIVTWTVLLIIGIGGIFRQNQIAAQNQKHIDCVVKLFTVPLPAGARSRTLSNPSTTCNINFAK